jgi:hypothetical protein
VSVSVPAFSASAASQSILRFSIIPYIEGHNASRRAKRAFDQRPSVMVR